jgi:hypothetical protein
MPVPPRFEFVVTEKRFIESLVKQVSQVADTLTEHIGESYTILMFPTEPTLAEIHQALMYRPPSDARDAAMDLVLKGWIKAYERKRRLLDGKLRLEA